MLSFGMADATLTLTLTGDDAERLARIMKSGSYATAEAAVREALNSFEGLADPALDVWLHNVVAQRFDAMEADPSRGVPLDEARRRLSGTR